MKRWIACVRPRATIIMASPEFQGLLKEVGARIVTGPSAAGQVGSPAQLAVPTGREMTGAASINRAAAALAFAGRRGSA